MSRDDGPFFFSCPERNAARVLPSRGPFYFAWGCFRDFVSGPRSAPPHSASKTRVNALTSVSKTRVNALTSVPKTRVNALMRRRCRQDRRMAFDGAERRVRRSEIKSADRHERSRRSVRLHIKVPSIHRYLVAPCKHLKHTGCAANQGRPSSEQFV